MSTDADNGPDMRAAEYVLGTLEPGERERVAAEMLHDRELCLEIAYWEEQLGQLGLMLAPVRPPRRVWRRIAMRTGVRDEGDSARGTRLWQGLALAASVAALALAAVLYVGVPTTPTEAEPPVYASMIHDDPTGAGWMLTAGAGDDRLTVTAIHAYPLPPDKSLHLWLLPPEGDPVSLGLMPAEGGKERMAMPEGAERMLDEGAKFAVSMEPPGGSPEPRPTGKVMWVVPVTARAG
ncbi:hypothetical protein PC39_00950 [Salinisphaera sp. PC39]|uniref:anti-sigma factor n=1 Tax=Salinisphaera sp. PC39 TaxID=1304156 RepID=UPI00333E6B82